MTLHELLMSFGSVNESEVIFTFYNSIMMALSQKQVVVLEVRVFLSFA